VLSADLEEIRCSRYRPGFFGFWRAGYASWKNTIPEIAAFGPVWAWNACTPARAYLKRESTHLPAFAFFLTVGGVGFEQALATMEALAGRKSEGKLVLKTEDFKPGEDRARIDSFAATLSQRKQPDGRHPKADMREYLMKPSPWKRFL
jgi:hypothetical protein